MVDEANIELHMMGFQVEKTLINDHAWEAAGMARVMGMAHYTGIMTCVIVWSLRNKAENGLDHYTTYQMLKTHFKSVKRRLIQYKNLRLEVDWSSETLLSIDWNIDLFCPMYSAPTLLK